jgi:hypothetical protein
VSRVLPRLDPLSVIAMVSVLGTLCVAFPVKTTAVSCAKLALFCPVAGDSVTSREVFVGTCAQ